MSRLLFVFYISNVGPCKAELAICSLLNSTDTPLWNEMELGESRVLHRLASAYCYKDDPKALLIAKKAESFALKSGDSLMIFKTQKLRGQILYRLGQIETAISTLEPLMRFDGEDEELLSVMTYLGICYNFLGRFDLALEYHSKTIALSESLGDSVYLAAGLQNLAIAYYKLEDHKKALPLFEKSYRIKKRSNTLDFGLPMNISLCYTSLGEHQNAWKFLRESIAVCGDNCPPVALTHILYTKGILHLAEAVLDSAEFAFQSSFAYAKDQGDARMQLDNIYSITEVLIRRGDFVSAGTWLDKADAIIRMNNDFNIEKIKVYSRMGSLYSKLQNFERAAFYQSKYIALRDSIYSVQLTTNLMNAEAEHRERENMVRIQTQQQIIGLNEALVRRGKVLNLAFIMIASVIAIAAVLLYRSYRWKSSLNVLLERKVGDRTRELELNQRLLLRSVDEKELEIKRILNHISRVKSTLVGLCFAGMRESSDLKARDFFGALEKEIRYLDGIPLVQRNNESS